MKKKDIAQVGYRLFNSVRSADGAIIIQKLRWAALMETHLSHAW